MQAIDPQSRILKRVVRELPAELSNTPPKKSMTRTVDEKSKMNILLRGKV